jgi:alpha-glucuronidase
MKIANLQNFTGKAIFLSLIVLFFITLTKADDGYRLWLRYDALPVQNSKLYQQQIKSLNISGNSSIVEAIRDEIKTGLSGLLGKEILLSEQVNNGVVVVGTPKNSTIISNLKLPLVSLGNDGYVIRSSNIKGKNIIVIAANSEIGTLYGISPRTPKAGCGC